MFGRRIQRISLRAPANGRLHWLKRTSAAAYLSVIAFGVGCDDAGADTSPELIVRDFILRMRSVHGDPKQARAAMDLLWKSGRENLTQRAERASDTAGRPVAPEEMLVPERFSLRFEPKRYSTEVKGKWSRVTVTGENPKTQLVEVHCVLEGEVWRVALPFPELPPIEQRRTRPATKR